MAECGGRTATAKTGPAEQEVALELTLPAGKTTLNGWFRDAGGTDLCGAFCAYVRKVN